MNNTERINDFFGRIYSPESNVLCAYFACNHREADGVLFRAITTELRKRNFSNYIIRGLYSESLTKLNEFFGKLTRLSDCCTQQELNQAHQFYVPLLPKIQESSMTNPPDVNDCELLVGTSKQNYAVKGIASGDGCFANVPNEIKRQYQVEIVDTKSPSSIQAFLALL